jgi:hypothetical protein
MAAETSDNTAGGLIVPCDCLATELHVPENPVLGFAHFFTDMVGPGPAAIRSASPVAQSISSVRRARLDYEFVQDR